MGPFWAILCVQFSLLYVFCLFGILFFGGEVNYQNIAILNNDSTPDIYIYVNFNDLANGLLTLFELMVINNWMIITQVYVNITGTYTILYFFIVFYYLCVVIGLNIVIAFSIDMYNSIERLDNQNKEHDHSLF